jgi:hypothetical protein
VAPDIFGAGTSVSGDTAAVSSQGKNSYEGAVYIFERNAGGPEKWGQVKEIQPSDGAPGNYFEAVSLSRDTLAVGAAGNNSRGAVYIFERNTGGTENWGQVKKLTNSDSVFKDGFGGSVCLEGDTLIAAAYNKGTNTGAVYVFERNAGGTENWGQVKELTASDGARGDYFGAPVSLSSNTLVAGAQGKNSYKGAAYIFERNAGGTENWGEIKELTASDGTANDAFGFGVAISGDIVVAGASDASYTNLSSGAVYVFERNAGGTENWGQTKRINAADAAVGDSFGGVVAIDGNALGVGAYNKDSGTGTTYVFDRNTGGSGNWGQVAEFTNSPGPAFGSAIAINSLTLPTMLVGAPGENNYIGAAYVYEGQTNSTSSSNTPPTAICHSVTKTADTNCQAVVTPAEVDNGSSDPDGDPITLSLKPSGPFPVGTNAVTLTVSDNHGASNSCTSFVVVLDSSSLEITCPSNITVEFTDINGAQVSFTPTATDGCSGPPLVTSRPASGSIFPIGTTAVICTAVNSSSNFASCSFQVTVLGAARTKNDVLADLTALRSSLTGADKRQLMKLNLAIRLLSASLDPAFWVDDTHLIPHSGRLAMNEEGLAVGALQNLMNWPHSSISTAELQGFIDRIVKSDRLLATVAINDASAAGFDAKKINQALADLADGDAKAAAGSPDQAIKEYTDAWKRVQTNAHRHGNQDHDSKQKP